MRATSILYHDVLEDPGRDDSGFRVPGAAHYKLAKREFAGHLRAMAAVLREPPALLSGAWPARDGTRPLFLTFDDGGASSMTAADLLEEHGWRGHFFITTDFISQRGFLRPSQIQELYRRGHIIGSHSCSHPERFSFRRWEDLLVEWEHSLQRLCDIVGQPVWAASLPGGSYRRRVAQAAAAAGIKTLFNSEPSTKGYFVDSCLVMGRYCVVRGASAETVAALASGQAAPRLRQWMFWNVRKLGKRLAGTTYHRLRDRVLN